MTNQSAQSGNKVILGLFVLAIVVVVGVVMYLKASHRDTVAEQEPGITERGRQMDFEKLKEQIHDKDVDVTILEKSLEAFVTTYGENTIEADELYMLLDKRKKTQIQAAKIKEEMTDTANEIKRSIRDPMRSIDYLESAVTGFIARFGEDQKEVRELRDLLAERKRQERKKAAREDAIVDRAKALIARINDESEDVNSLQSAVSEFVIDYGDDRKEIPELRRLLEERKKVSEKKLRREDEIADEAKKLAARINNEDENLSRIESALSDFMIRYGQDRKEIPELRRLIGERKEAERLKSRMAEDGQTLIRRIKDPEYSLQDLEQGIKDFVDYYGEDHDILSEINQVFSARKEEEERERMIANEVRLLSAKMNDQNYTVDELQQFLDDFVRKHGEGRVELSELQIRLKERRESDLMNRLSQEAQDLMEQIKDRTNTMDSLQASLEKFTANFGDNHAEIHELRRLLDDRQSEDAIAEYLSSLDAFLLSGDITRIRSMVADTEYANKLVALTGWPGLVFRHHIQFFQRDKESAQVRVELENAANHVPRRKFHFNYSFFRDDNAWKIKRSEKIEN